jgi:DNA-binding GntR family transcriptional regulator
MTRQREGRSLVEDAYTAIRASVLSGRLAPGTRVALKELATERDVSLSVIREAVTRLASERLLVATPQHGFAVQTLSLKDLEDVTWTRLQIETIALRESLRHGDLAWEANLVAAHHALGATSPVGSDGGPNPQWMVAHSAFHAALTAGADRPWLSNIRQQLFDASELYRYWSAGHDARSGALNRRLRTVEKEHKALLQAALGRDVKKACELIRQHFEATAAVLARNAAANGEE